MGASSSSLSELGHNDYLKRLSGTEPVNPMDPFWNQLLSFSFLIPVSSADARLLEESTSLIARNFAINNCHTGNLQALVHNFMIRATELKASAQCEDNIFIWQTYNSLFIIRCLCKYFVEHLSEELLIQQFDCRPPNADGTPADDTDDEIGAHIEKFITALVELLVDVPVLNFTYALHLESLNMLLVLLSIQMFQPQPATQFKLYNYLMHGKCAIHAPLLVKVLLWNYINQEKCPAELFKNNEEAGLLSSVTNAVASSLWSVMTLGMGSKAKKPEETDVTETLLANQSLLLLLVLTNHCTVDRGTPPNPYRDALFSFTDANESG
ncbi:dymeclin-like [Littorina saxatilis]|uniref:dymeclin-like n=1 Tax=Littorina saxatilis TaxID=31220 RepID=UPI0038B4C5B9